MTPGGAGPPRARIAPRLLLAVGLSAAVAYVTGLAVRAPAVSSFAKPLPVLCLALWVLASAAGRYARLVAAGLGLSLAGDVLLEFERVRLPLVAPLVELDGFALGLAAFLLAHLSYIAAFVSASRRAALGRAAPFALFGAGFYLHLRPGLAGLAVPVALYVAALCAMMWRAAACVGSTSRGRAAERAALAGAILFAASDSLIGLDRFHAPIPGVRYPIILLYWLGQLGIAAAAVDFEHIPS